MLITQEDFEPGDAAPETGLYIANNVFGTPIDMTLAIGRGQTLPALPRGFTWRPLSAHSTQELRDRAEQYRQMGRTASTEKTRDSLLGLAARFDGLADHREEPSKGENC